MRSFRARDNSYSLPSIYHIADWLFHKVLTIQLSVRPVCTAMKNRKRNSVLDQLNRREPKKGLEQETQPIQQAFTEGLLCERHQNTWSSPSRKEYVTMGRAGNTTSCSTHRASSIFFLVSLETRTMFTGQGRLKQPGRPDRSDQGGDADRNLFGCLMTEKERLSDDDIKVREQEDSGFNFQMVALSSSQAWLPDHQILRSVWPLCLGMEVTYSILPVCPRFFMLVVISCNSHLQRGKRDQYKRVDNSFLHHNSNKYISIVLH